MTYLKGTPQDEDRKTRLIYIGIVTIAVIVLTILFLTA